MKNGEWPIRRCRVHVAGETKREGSLHNCYRNCGTAAFHYVLSVIAFEVPIRHQPDVRNDSVTCVAKAGVFWANGRMSKRLPNGIVLEEGEAVSLYPSTRAGPISADYSWVEF